MAGLPVEEVGSRLACKKCHCLLQRIGENEAGLPTLRCPRCGVTWGWEKAA